MVTFISIMIEKTARKSGVEAGKKKYEAYFVKTDLYKEFRDEVDAILIADGFEGCISEANRA